jgi:sulfite reductase (NADPH) flavoprotein alpha-component
MPIVMVGPGTGVAPFRSFLWQRKAAKAKAWLFFGHQHEATDFFYRDELEAFLADGTLARLSTACSRDGKEKVYVQGRMREAGPELWAWLRDGAHFYVCGDTRHMARDVENALVEISSRAAR